METWIIIGIGIAILMVIVWFFKLGEGKGCS